MLSLPLICYLTLAYFLGITKTDSSYILEQENGSARIETIIQAYTWAHESEVPSTCGRCCTATSVLLMPLIVTTHFQEGHYLF